ncbi:ATP-binding cassette domain-containing protein [Mucisphaera sp.]|uniref:ATP-binding cassette domain-containing protein n=1 Tax=Mucisphaera sp. TaxID=2913024 RepID=UPI003D0CC8A7
MLNNITVEISPDLSPQPAIGRLAAEAAACFGLDAEHPQPPPLFQPFTLSLRPYELIFLTGPSGTGKSTLLRTLEQALIPTHLQPDQHIRLDALPPWPNRPIAEGFPTPLPNDLDATTRWMSLAGLAEAPLLLRQPRHLSQGQHFRLQLAQALALAEHQIAQQPKIAPVVIADEFAAPLDRLTAANIARTLRRWVNQTPCAFIAATTHDDLLEPLNPNTLIELTPAGETRIHTR